MGTWSVIVPQAATNFVLNPSAEVVGNFAALAGGTITRVTAQQYKGAHSFRIQGAADGDGGTLTLAVLANADHVLTLYIKGTPGADGVQVSVDGGGNWATLAMATLADWTLFTAALAAADCSGSVEVQIAQWGAGAMDMYVDAVQIELGTTPTTYLDADQPGCTPLGAPHRSATMRSGTSREGGVAVNLSAYIRLRDKLGVGTPPLENISTPFGLAGGAQYQRTVKQVRTFTLLGTVQGDDIDDMHLLQRQLFDLIKPDLVNPQQPVALLYSPGAAGPTLHIRAVYEGGLEFESQEVNVMTQVPLRFLAHDPLWYEEQDSAAVLAFTQTIAATNYILQRTFAGVWQTLGAGLSDWPVFMIIGPDGALYVGGNFVSAGGGVVNYIAKWDGTSWSALDTGLDGAGIAGAFDAAGNFYVLHTGTGRFSMWDGAAWSVVGGGLDDASFFGGVAVDGLGNVYVGANFDLAGAVPCSNIAMWNGAWNALGAGTDNSVFCCIIGPDGYLYVGGSFVTAGGITCNGVARWDGATWTALGGGMTAGFVQVNCMAFGPDGNLYVGGSFTAAGGVPCANIAKWNGVAWYALGSGVDTDCYTIQIEASGLVRVTGKFSQAGGLITYFVATWNGSTWAQSDATPASIIYSGVTGRMGDVFLGTDGSGAGASITSVMTTAVNGGSADAHPIIQFTGPGAIVQLFNYTTGDRLWFNLTLLAGEVATLDLTPGAISFRSNFRGNVIGTILPGSNQAMWKLAPGANALSCFVTGSTGDTEVTLWHPEAHWSIDGVR